MARVWILVSRADQAQKGQVLQGVTLQLWIHPWTLHQVHWRGNRPFCKPRGERSVKLGDGETSTSAMRSQQVQEIGCSGISFRVEATLWDWSRLCASHLRLTLTGKRKSPELVSVQRRRAASAEQSWLVISVYMREQRLGSHRVTVHDVLHISWSWNRRQRSGIKVKGLTEAIWAQPVTPNQHRLINPCLQLNLL